MIAAPGIMMVAHSTNSIESLPANRPRAAA